MYLQEKLVLQEKNWAVPPLEQEVRIAYAIYGYELNYSIQMGLF